MTETIVIPHRFRGPTNSANGGYACGVLGRRIGGTAEITLRRPPPLDTSLQVLQREDGGLALHDGEALLAEAIPSSLDILPPKPVTWEEAASATAGYLGFSVPDSPPCFVCGPSRAAPDGLRVFPSPVAGRDVVAAPWLPDASVASAHGSVPAEIVWAILDCTGTWATLGDSPSFVPLLGRQRAKVTTEIIVGERYVVVGWPLGREGRKLSAGVALYSADGEVCAAARVLCIAPREAPTDSTSSSK